jgi:hypothetical protein
MANTKIKGDLKMKNKMLKMSVIAIAMAAFNIGFAHAANEKIVNVKLTNGSVGKVSASELRKSLNALNPGVKYFKAFQQKDQSGYKGVFIFAGIQMQAADQKYYPVSRYMDAHLLCVALGMKSGFQEGYTYSSVDKSQGVVDGPGNPVRFVGTDADQIIYSNITCYTSEER